MDRDAATPYNRMMMVVRGETDADVDTVAALHVRTWQAGYAGILPADVLDALDPAEFAARRRGRGRREGAGALVAVHDRTIVGFVQFGPARAQPGHDVAASDAEVYAMYVDPAHWGRGVGQALLRAAFEAMSGLGMDEVRLWVLTANHRARRFYERCGMTPDGGCDVYRLLRPSGETVEVPELRYAARLR